MKRNKLRVFAAIALLAASTVLPSFASEVEVAVEDPDVLGPADNVVAARAESSKTQTNYEPTAEDMQSILKKIRPRFTLPETYTEFDWNYNSPTYYRAASWRFTWEDTQGEGRVRVVADTNGSITSYSKDDYSRKRSISLPRYSKETLAETAKASLAALCPAAAPSMKLTGSYASSLYSQSFYYTFTRYENDIIVPDDTATVSVNYVTGELTSVSCTYHDGLAFDTPGALSAEDAKKALTAAQTMKLSYRLKTEYDEDGNAVARKAYLVYAPEKSYLSADASTGEIYTERNTWSVDTTSGAGGSNSSAKLESAFDAAESEDEEAGGYELPEEELAGLEILKSLISRDEAIRAVLENDALYIEESATAVNAQLMRENDYSSLNADGKEQSSYRWVLSFTAPYNESKKENGYYYAYMRATVDASTGKLISFRSSVPGYDYYVNETKVETPPAPSYTAEQADELFRAFADTQIADYMQNVRLSASTEATPIEYTESAERSEREPIYRVARLNYTRVNEDVDFSYNGVYGAVDRVTGKITSFSYSWYDDVTFESPALAVTPEKAYAALLDSDGFGLNYEINSDYTYKQYMADSKDGYLNFDELYDTSTYTRLVWSGYNYGTSLVSALTGKLINYSGEEYKPETSGAYTDIDGHWAGSDIELLTDLGFRFENGGTLFEPDKAITEKELFKLMSYFGKNPSESVPESGATDETLTRTKAVRYIMDAAGYYRIASMPDIFITDFADNSELAREDVGFIAIARGMGLVQGDASLFRPYDTITRAEAVTLTLNFLKASE